MDRAKPPKAPQPSGNGHAFHPVAAIFPLMEDRELAELAEDIRKNGLRQRITTYEGKILDGRNRSTACMMAGVEPRTVEFTGTRLDALAFVWSMNRERRHLTSSQAAAAEVMRDEVVKEHRAEIAKIAEEARRRKQNGRPPRKVSGVRGSIELPEKVQAVKRPSAYELETDTLLAEAAGTNPAYLRAARRIAEQSPALLDEVLKGKRTIPQATAEINREERRRELRARAKVAKQFAGDQPKWDLVAMDVVDGLQSVLDHRTPARLVFADPPYNIGVDYGRGAKADRLPDDAYMAWVEKWLGFCCDCLADDGSLWVLIGDEYAAEYAVTLKGLGLTIRSWIKWYETFGVNCAKCFNRTSRHLFYCVRDPKRFVFHPEVVNRKSDRQTKYADKRANPNGKIWDDVWGVKPAIPRLTGTCKERLPDVPTQLPVALIRPIVECASDPGDLVVDPFVGSGTTGEACLIARPGPRKFFGIDSSKKFIEIARQRLEGTG